MERGSYMLIQPGMPVVGPDGNLGSVIEVIADVDVDVFRGIILSHGLLFTRRAFISADAIVQVTESEVDVSVSRTDLNRMPAQPAAI
jgi:uncharacterized protein YrrD